MTIERQDMAVSHDRGPGTHKTRGGNASVEVGRGAAPRASLATQSRRQVVIRRDCVASETLLSAGGYLLIQHGGYCYQLRQTAAGKLILTKEPGFERHVAYAMQD